MRGAPWAFTGGPSSSRRGPLQSPEPRELRLICRKEAAPAEVAFLVSGAGAGLGAAREPPAPHAATSLSRLASCHCKVSPVTFELGTCVVLVSPPRSLPERPLCKKPHRAVRRN